MLAMLSAAHLRPIAPQALNHLLKAAARWDEGDAGLAQVHLALSGVDRLSDPVRAAHRLFLAEGLLQAGIEPDAVLRALNLDPSILESLDKQYDRNQPRVPAGSGRTSGQWTDGAGDAAATRLAASRGQSDASPMTSADRMGASLIPAKYDARDTTGIGRPQAAPAPDLLETAPKVFTPGAARGLILGLTAEQLAALGLFALRFGGPTAVLGVLLFPTNASLRRDGVIPGRPPIQYHWNADERILRLSYLGPDSRRVRTTAELGEDGFFRDVDRNVIGRVLPNGGIATERAAVFPKDVRNDEEPTLCPAPTPDKDHKNANGLLFENYMKPIVNPGNPTPSGLGVTLFNSAENKYVFFDDCQRRSGILFKYKGVTYSDLFDKPFQENVMKGLIRQAELQLGAAEGQHIIWVFAEKAAEARVEETFNEIPELRSRIQFEDMPWGGWQNMRNYKWYMNCSRSSGVETPASIGERYLRTLDALTAIDPVLGGWTIWESSCTLNELEAWAGAGSPEPAPIRPVLIEDARRDMTALVEANVQLNDWGEPQPDEGYNLVANNKDNLTPRNVGISVTAGAELSRNTWSVSTGMMGGEPPVDPALITYPILGGAFRVMTSIWPTPWATLCGSTTEYGMVPSSAGFGFVRAMTFRHEITWMGYLSAERAAGFEPPSELISERGADGGLLMIAVEERPDPDNPDHMRRSDLLSSIMQRFYIDPFPRRRPAQT